MGELVGQNIQNAKKTNAISRDDTKAQQWFEVLFKNVSTTHLPTCVLYIKECIAM